MELFNSNRVKVELFVSNISQIHFTPEFSFKCAFTGTGPSVELISAGSPTKSPKAFFLQLSSLSEIMIHVWYGDEEALSVGRHRETGGL